MRRSIVCLSLFFILLAFVTIGLLISDPSYWLPPDPANEIVIQLAEAVESRVTTQTTMVRTEAEEWELELTDGEVNAWLATRLPLWMENQGIDPEPLDSIPRGVVHFEPRGIHVAAEFNASRIVAVRYFPVSDAVTGGLSLRLTAIQVGRMPVPLTLKDHLVAEKLKGLFRSVERIEPVLTLDDGRVVEVVRVELLDGRARFHCRTRRTILR